MISILHCALHFKHSAFHVPYCCISSRLLFLFQSPRNLKDSEAYSSSRSSPVETNFRIQCIICTRAYNKLLFHIVLLTITSILKAYTSNSNTKRRCNLWNEIHLADQSLYIRDKWQKLLLMRFLSTKTNSLLILKMPYSRLKGRISVISFKRLPPYGELVNVL